MKCVTVREASGENDFTFFLQTGGASADSYRDDSTTAPKGREMRPIKGCGNETIMKRAQELRTKLKSVGLL